MNARKSIRTPARPRLMERRMSKLLRNPPSVRLAAGVIVTATALVVVGAGILIRVLDHEEYGSIWVGMWWAIQTVTTVGYGDVVPRTTLGRVIGGAEMVFGVSFIAFLTAGVTSTVIRRAEADQPSGDIRRVVDGVNQLTQTLEQIDTRLEKIESRLGG
jgi:voltage-gated potassium channel Kch